ncbi:SEC-C metal-binding domain-containing protein [Actinomadura alba]|uniref:SEC-C metal-binding domain-containing protein n=1 Tax=Actinomadura alba TaxID=406431 RepID=UPI001C9BEB55|nr:SEC-C metal-binding domain-containing protein [Actinomadura alba]
MGGEIVGGQKELIEKLGGKDPCPCGSGRRFPALLPVDRPLRRSPGRPLRTAA